MGKMTMQAKILTAFGIVLSLVLTVSCATAPASAPTSAPPTVPAPTTAPTQARAFAPPTSPPNAVAGEPREVLRNAFARLNTVGPYRITETSTVTVAGKTQTLEIVRELVPPASVRVLSKPALVFPEMITIGNVWYTKDLNGKWSKSDKPQNPSGNTPAIADILAKAISDVQLVGPEVLNGTPTMAYSMKINFAEMSLAGTAKVWIGVADALPRRVVLQGTQSAQSGTPVQLETRDIYEYDKSIKVVPPIP